MFDTYLVPQTTVAAKGDSEAVDVSAAQSRVFLALLSITDIVEQESLEITVFGSVDGTNWSGKPIAAFPQQFYKGEYPLLVNLGTDMKFLRAHWEVNRWGRGSLTPMFAFSIKLTEVPPELLRETRAGKTG